MNLPTDQEIKLFISKYPYHIGITALILVFLALILIIAPGEDEAPTGDAPAVADGTAQPSESVAVDADQAADAPADATADEIVEPAGIEAEEAVEDGAFDAVEEAEIDLPPPGAEPVDGSRPVATLRALDKITAAITEIEAAKDDTIAFGSLQITLRTCRSRPPEEPPETFAFLEIDDETRPEEERRIFSGWMMASSPALNPLEHAIYDVWVISCTIVAPGVSSDRE